MLFATSKTSYRFLFLLILLPLSIIISSDMPGNKGRPDITLELSNARSLNPYLLYLNDNGSDNVILIEKDTAYVIFGSHGAPHEVMLFAKNDKISTDTLFFSNVSQENISINFTGIVANKLVYELKKAVVPVSKEFGDEKGLSSESKILIGISIAALLGLVAWFFLYRKKQKNKTPAATV